MTVWTGAAIGMGIAITIFIVGLEALILIKIATNQLPLKGLLCEPGDDAKASLSRFQFLLFTFVIAGVYLLLSLESGTLVNIPENVLWLIGISGGSYITSKGIKTWGDSTVDTAGQKADEARSNAAAEQAKAGTTIISSPQ